METERKRKITKNCYFNKTHKYHKDRTTSASILEKLTYLDIKNKILQ